MEYYYVYYHNALLDQLGQLTPVERPSEGGGEG